MAGEQAHTNAPVGAIIPAPINMQNITSDVPVSQQCVAAHPLALLADEQRHALAIPPTGGGSEQLAAGPIPDDAL